MSDAKPPREALLTAMALSPSVYSRNRLFTLFRDPEVRWLKKRAAVLRGVAHQLAERQGNLDALEWSHEDTVRLSYRIGPLRLRRHVELTRLEAACVAHLASSWGARAVNVTDEHRALIDEALARLAPATSLAEVDVER